MNPRDRIGPAPGGALALLALLAGVLGGCSSPQRAPKPEAGAAPIASAASPALDRVRHAPNDVAARLALAAQAAQSGEHFAAIEQLEVARALGDTDPGTALRLADQYAVLGEMEAAVAVVADAGARRPNADLQLAEVRYRLKLGDFDAAAHAAKPLTSQWDALPREDRQALVRTLLLAGKTELAAKRIPTNDPDRGWLGLRGQLALAAGQTARAIEALTRANATGDPDGRLLLLLGRAYRANGDPVRALEALSRAANAPDPPVQATLEAARLLTQQNRLDDAETLLHRVDARDRKAPAFWDAQSELAARRGLKTLAQIGRGYAVFNAGDPWQAEAIWRAALPQAGEEDAAAIYTALFNSAAWRQAAQDSYSVVTEAAKRFPRNFYFLESRAEVLKDLNRPVEAEAVADALQALETPERAGQTADLQARIALKFGEATRFANSIRQERALAPHSPQTALHEVEWQLKQAHTPAALERALALCREAMALDPGNAEAPYRAGLILNELKRPEEALAMLLHAATLAPRLQFGAVSAMLHQVEQHQGLSLESAFEVRWNQAIRKSHDDWASRVKLLYQNPDAPHSTEWKALGTLALGEHEPWIALCAAVRAARLTPHDPEVWRLKAAAQRRLGQVDEAAESMRVYRQCAGTK